ncbi:ATP-binding protein [Streptomyces sp. BI20]|uniref:ATP-binding protein n=1 Tax=Streptomyces sp. BI20 TaxID=3403460 RepID=UPI003C75C3A3
MSHLRAARHVPSRHAAPPAPPRRGPASQLTRAAVLPVLACALSGAAAVMFTLQLGGGHGARDERLGPLLAGCGLLVVGALVAALLGARRTGRMIHTRCEELRRVGARGRAELNAVTDRIVPGGSADDPAGPHPAPTVSAGPGRSGRVRSGSADPFDGLAEDMRRSREHAQAAVRRVAGHRVGDARDDRRVEVFVNLARRLQSLVHREISLLDTLEDTVEDPDLLRELFHVDHLATRIRRHAENLAVLGGAASRRQWTRPVDLSEVMRSAVAEVEQYTRVTVVPPAGGLVRGHAVADVVHLLAELVENATVFSAPDTDVLVRAETVTAGLAVEVEDRGLGMPDEERRHLNALLADPDTVDVRDLLADGRIGLFVVATLARRHGIAVELGPNLYGGVRAAVVLPGALLGTEAGLLTGAGTATAGTEPDATGEPAGGAEARNGWAAHGATAHALGSIPAAAPTPTSTPAPAPVATHAPGVHPAPAPSPDPFRFLTLPSPAPASAPVPGPAPVPPLPERRRTPSPSSGPTPPPPEAPGGARPPLPRRGGRTAEEALGVGHGAGRVPAPPAAEAPAADPHLMAAFQRGFGRAQTRPADPHPHPHPHPHPNPNPPPDPRPPGQALAGGPEGPAAPLPRSVPEPVGPPAEHRRP